MSLCGSRKDITNKCICSNKFTLSYYFRWISECKANSHYCSCKKNAKKCLKTHDHICTCSNNPMWCKAGINGLPKSKYHMCVCPDRFCRAVHLNLDQIIAKNYKQ